LFPPVHVFHLTLKEKVMLTPEAKKTFRSVADVIFTIGRGNNLRVSLEDLLDELNQTLPTVLDHDLGKDLRAAKTQLELRISGTEIRKEIARQTAQLAAVEDQIKKSHELVALARNIERRTGG